MKWYFLFVFVITTVFCNSQNSIKFENIEKELEELKKKNVTDYFFIHSYCYSDDWFLETTVNCDDDAKKLFIFWQEKNKSYYRQIDRCESPRQELPDSVFVFFTNYKNEFKLESVKPYQSRSVHNGIESFNPVTVDHSCYSTLQFWENGYQYTKGFDWFNLSSEKEYENVHKDTNNSLKFVEFVKMCSELTNKKKSRGSPNSRATASQAKEPEFLPTHRINK